MGNVLRWLAIGLFLAVPAAAAPPARAGRIVRDSPAERERLAARLESLRATAALRSSAKDLDARRIDHVLAKAEAALDTGNLRGAADYVQRAADLVDGKERRP